MAHPERAVSLPAERTDAHSAPAERVPLTEPPIDRDPWDELEHDEAFKSRLRDAALGGTTRWPEVRSRL